MKATKITKLLDMRSGYGLYNILGISDPSVHMINGQWTMFVGGFNSNFKTNIYTLTLPKGDAITCNDWRFNTEPNNTRRAKPLITQPDSGNWDGYGLHSPSYSKGVSGGREVERVYYAGRKSKKITDNSTPYQIGYLEKVNSTWRHNIEPLPITGTNKSPNVLEPKVEYMDNKWRLRYVTTPQEAGKKSEPCYAIMYIESEDGVTNWSEPKELFSYDEGYYDSVVVEIPGKKYGMALTRNSNLYQKDNYPEQGVWWAESNKLSGLRSDWSQSPTLVIDPSKNNDWYKNGMCGPSIVIENNVAHIFFVATTKKTNWLSQAARNVMRGHLPPAPAPYYLAIGRADFEL